MSLSSHLNTSIPTRTFHDLRSTQPFSPDGTLSVCSTESGSLSRSSIPKPPFTNTFLIPQIEALLHTPWLWRHYRRPRAANQSRSLIISSSDIGIPISRLGLALGLELESTRLQRRSPQGPNPRICSTGLLGFLGAVTGDA